MGGGKKRKPQLTQVYMHFDNLIWKLPTWVFSIFTVGIAVIALLSQGNYSIENIVFGFRISEIISYMFLGFGILGLILVYAMYRFRIHQTKEKKKSAINPVSPQICIQIFSNVLVTVLFLIWATLLSGEFSKAIYPIVIIAAVIISILLEIIVYMRNKIAKALRKNKQCRDGR